MRGRPVRGGEVKNANLFFVGDEIGANDEDEVAVRVGLRNDGPESFVGDPEFGAVWQPRENTRWGDVVIKHLVHKVGPIGPGETVFADEWSAT